MNSKNCFYSVLPLVTLILIAGCSSQIKAPKTVPVSGTVTRQGKPLAGVVVTFHPQFNIGKTEFEPSGETNAEGKFTLSTANGGDGAPPGEYVVTMIKPRIESDPNQSGIEVEVDELKWKFNDIASSPWTVTVENDETVLEPFNIE